MTGTAVESCDRARRDAPRVQAVPDLFLTTPACYGCSGWRGTPRSPAACPSSGPTRHPVQRFASTEHVVLGDTASKEHTGIRYTEDPKDELSFGEVAAIGP
jgi:hypothetical protein